MERKFYVVFLVISLSVLAIMAGAHDKWDFCAAFATGVFALLKGEDIKPKGDVNG